MKLWNHCVAVTLSVWGTIAVEAADWRWESAGVRHGVSASSFSSLFQQSEAFVRVDMPWRWDFAAHWRLQTRMDVSAGWFGGNRDHAFIGALGPSVGVKHENFPVELEAGSNPTFLRRYHFGNTDFGIPFQFTSFLGLSADIGKRWGAGYRFQHMSNAGLGTDNPGLNMHMFSVRYRF
jgi:lipid A 3-O-deacylase